MFSKIVVALNDLPESQRELRTAIELAQVSNAELATVPILAYTSFAIVVDPSAPNMMEEERRRAHGEESISVGPGAWSSRERLDRRGAGGTGDTSFP